MKIFIKIIAKLRSFMPRASIVRMFFSLLIAVYISSIVADTSVELQIFITVLIFILINTIAKVIPIEDILTKL